MQVENEGLRARLRARKTRFAEASSAETSRRLHDLRGRIAAAASLHRGFDAELFRSYATGRESSLVAVLGLALLVQGFSLLVVDGLTAAANLFAITAANLVAVLNTRALLAQGEDLVLPSARRRAVLAELLCGLAWVPVIIPFMQEGSIGSTIMLFVAWVVLAIACIVGAPVPATIIAMAGPVIVALVAIFTLHRTIEGGIFAALTCAGVTFFIVLAMRLNRNAIESFAARAEKDLLIAELEEARVTSDDARRRAESANVAKSQFLAQMSHELRTPLNAILGFSEVLAHELYGPLTVPQYKEYAADIHSSGKHLLNVINEVLDISRIEAGRTQLHEEAVMLAFIAEDCQHLLRVRARNKHITMTEHIDRALPRIWADERAVRQIVLNLMSNAVKFTPQGGEIVISVGWTSNGGQFISVRDNGPGIPEDEIPQVLSTFGQGTNAIKVAEQGTGLGLPIVQGLVELHGGTFSLTSKVNEGTEVVVTFPAERVMQGLPSMPSAPLQPQKADFFTNGGNDGQNHAGALHTTRFIAGNPHRPP